jgi:hypothetical protein
MNNIRFTLVGEGSSDANLIPILEWALREQEVEVVQGQFARWDLLPKRPKTLVEKIVAGLKLFECDLLFVHRDADNAGQKPRRDETATAILEVKSLQKLIAPSVPVIPIRETEAWLLVEEKAIRKAANNPNGKVGLNLPPLKRIEKCFDPKKELQRVLRLACEYSPQNLSRFDVNAATAHVVDHISDFKILRKLSAFQSLEADLAALRANGWK